MFGHERKTKAFIWSGYSVALGGSRLDWACGLYRDGGPLPGQRREPPGHANPKVALLRHSHSASIDAMRKGRRKRRQKEEGEGEGEGERDQRRLGMGGARFAPSRGCGSRSLSFWSGSIWQLFSRSYLGRGALDCCAERQISFVMAGLELCSIH